MPRTPLLRSVAQLVKDNLRAEAHGLPTDEFRGMQAEAAQRRAAAGISRRQLLAGASAAAVAGTLLVPKRANADDQPKIAIIGAGIAGLSTALKLADHGIASTVYEASGRVGGRMFSNANYFDQGQVFEWCGELIDSNHATIRGLADRFGLQLDDLKAGEPVGSTDTFYFNGQFYSKAQADQDFKDHFKNNLRSDLQKAGYPTTVFESTPYGRWLDQMSLYDYIEWRIPGGHRSPLGALLDVAYFIELNSDTREQSALNLIYLLAYQPNWSTFEMFGISDEKYHVRGGNQQIPMAIANHLGPSVVKTSMRLESIRQTPAGAYDLSFRSNGASSVVTADMVVVTTPFAVLRDLDTRNAGFDAQKNYAIQNLGAGRQSKQHLQFTRRVWNDKGNKPAPGNGNSYSDTGYQSTWETSRSQPGTNGILVGYAGGDFADAMRSTTAFATSSSPSVRADAQRFLAQAEPVFQGLTAAWNGKSTQGLPHLDPNMKCSYSYFKQGHYQTIGGYERVRQGNVFFAGEHCSMDFQGFMEGGASEGERAAREILAQLGLRVRK